MKSAKEKTSVADQSLVHQSLLLFWSLILGQAAALILACTLF
jgi:hypothetical protein